MSFVDVEEVLESKLADVAIRAAVEGIPTAAIARILNEPFDIVSDTLTVALGTGAICSLPKPDWPPTARLADHLPSAVATIDSKETEFQLKRLFKLTKLEVGFMIMLLKSTFVDKDRLHGVVEQQRATRLSRPDAQETTDPKIVDVIICKLRKKLKVVDPKIVLETSWGQGYYFDSGIKVDIFKRARSE